MSRQQKFAFGIIDFSDYHKVPVFDIQTGRPKVNARTKEQFVNWIKCEGLGCENCKKKYEKKFGHNPHWPMSWGHFQIIRGYDREVGQSCRNCRNIDTVSSVAWTCMKCGEAAIDMSSTNLKLEDVLKTVEKLFTCPCGHVDFLHEVIVCAKCPKADRMTLFDVELKVKRIPMGQGDQTNLNISSWVPRRVLNPVQETELGTPKDLWKYFGPTDNKIQLERFGPPPLKGPDGPDGEAGEDTGSEPETPAPNEQSRSYQEVYK